MALAVNDKMAGKLMGFAQPLRLLVFLQMRNRENPISALAAATGHTSSV
ncbi:predicted protein [Brucella abortus bv. 4 str. 292]|uniref:Uncharacterized protein n=9 Tax=Brucella TaxID=234 RepID=Q2YPJ3_BRUA2|nr:hypothetical protein BR0317 [Brucella suis 1330]AAX73743.1 hypothetical protein BruAb1_0343 [Brucella abortus bv. 1 str. 9-941]ABQ60622.1 hypothetical protein BOV_0333 [Brucella ovis ATCC 25840]ABX61416.1 Hypothetical protein, conserved [Brucella canis ATCC 23365]ABY37438.1 Hypothetical protein, conserved [Brucella suis ATCC 23445]ACU47333.1 hypothetical protein BMI_I323 [Brucella microti CCM 4915]AEK53659.1 hypothetical protein BPI_I352 [Brucella pinnipedialis B2/94]AEU05347.1 hypothetic